MPLTRRVQLLFDPDEYELLRFVAEQRKRSVNDLVRAAVRDAYLEQADRDRRMQAVRELCAMNLDLGTDEEIEAAIESMYDSYDDVLP